MLKHWYSFILFIFLYGCTAKTPQVGVQQGVLFDHHVHLMSPALIKSWQSMGIHFSRPDQSYANVDTILNNCGAVGLSLIAMGYVHTSAEFGAPGPEAYQKWQHENDYLAEAKLKYPGQIKAYFGVDPMHPQCMDEIVRCHQVLKMDGIKLHFNANQVYLTVPEHLQKVRPVFSYAATNELPILLHFDNSHPKFGNPDVMLLTDSILADLPFYHLQIAHFGTSGGFNERTKRVLDAMLLYFQNHPNSADKKIVLDISAVALDKDSEGVSKLNVEEWQQLSAYCRKIGFDKIVFGSDYPLYNSPQYLNILIEKLNLNEQEIKQLLQTK